MKKYNHFPIFKGEVSDLEIGQFVISVSTLEVLLSRIEQKNNEIDYKKILQSLVSGYEEKCKCPDYFNEIGFQTNFFTRGYMIAIICEQCFDISSWIESSTALLFDKETCDKINELSYILIE